MKNNSLAIIAALFLLTACDQSNQDAAVPAPAQETVAPTTMAPTVHYSEWLGRWVGVEGTYLEITEREIGYRITIRDLDGPEDYDGVSVDNGIRFTRNGKDYVLHPGTGVQTGMKWLADKKHCLIVNTGEGYCRD